MIDAPAREDVAMHAAIEMLSAGGVTVKLARFEAGKVLAQHSHTFDHFAVLLSGTVMLEVDGIGELHSGPQLLTIPAHKRHTVTSLTKVEWLCLWGDHLDDSSIIESSAE